MDVENPNAQKYLDGQVLLIDKPLEWTSFDVVNKIRYQLKNKFNLKKIKVGHAGTLDPLATGLLILCTGKFTKRIDEIQAQVKEYTGTITLGATTPSYDLETEIDQTFETDSITVDMIKVTAESFIGESMQMPPVFSAKKVDGKKAYIQARKGKEVKLQARPVTITEFDVEIKQMSNVDFRIVCSKGTYIRSIAYDFGQKLNNGAHLSALRRTKIGDYHVADALSVDEFVAQLEAEAK